MNNRKPTAKHQGGHTEARRSGARPKPPQYLQGESDHKTRKERIDVLLQHQLLWRGHRNELHNPSTKIPHSITTGYRQLDHHLHYKGWPLGQLLECLQTHTHGPGIDLFIPAVNQLQLAFANFEGSAAQSSWQSPLPIILVNPPYIPYLDGWTINYGNPLWVIRTHDLRESIWAAEQVLRSDSYLAAFIWLDVNNSLDSQTKSNHSRSGSSKSDGEPTKYRSNAKRKSPIKTAPSTQLRKLQLAAKASRGLSILFQPQQAALQPSPATLRIQVSMEATPNHHASNSKQHHIKRSVISTNILKQPGGWGGQHCFIPWQTQLQQPRIPIQQWPVHKPKTTINDGNWSSSDQLTTDLNSQRYS